MDAPDLAPLRARIRATHVAPSAEVLGALKADAPSPEIRKAAHARAAEMVRGIRDDARPGLMEVFLAEYGLSTDEGVALMCLAEALLRVPDAETIDALIEDKIAPSEWSAHLGQSSSPLVNASTWGLMLTGSLMRPGSGPAATLRAAIRRVGEPVIRAAVSRAIRELGHQFVLGRDIDEAVRRGAAAKGYTFSYDMLGEAAMTAADARGFHAAYAGAIAKLAPLAEGSSIRTAPGISIKLSALHPRYETVQRDRVMAELVPAALDLTLRARRAGLGLNIDAEESARLDISLDVIEAILSDPRLSGWDGFGVVVQAYGKRAGATLDWLNALATRLDRRIMVRLVKGAYWDTEIKLAQVEGLPGFPVYERKAETDIAYLCCAGKLLRFSDRIYPQFATHNALSVAAILEMAEAAGLGTDRYEFQRLHGMGAALYDRVLAAGDAACRIYAPVGAHRDLLAYLVRRLLENGANSSFVNQIVDKSVPPEVVAADPFDAPSLTRPSVVTEPAALFAPERPNSRGWDLTAPDVLADLQAAMAPWQREEWQAGPILATVGSVSAAAEVTNPATGGLVGYAADATETDVAAALSAAQVWNAPAEERAAVLRRAADLYEAAYAELFACLTREAGKALPDAVAELREAVDFLRYYAARAATLTAPARGVITCVSPWNFPLAIFTGQIAAALAAGNAVLAKPAEATPLIASLGVRLLQKAGVPNTALQLLPGPGATVGAALTADPRVKGVAFTGSTATAQAIHRSMAAHLDPDALLIAETGGLNAMVVDSTALPEQAVRDILLSAFRSAGQRCSALRMLYVQDDIAESFIEMLVGAMDELRLGDPWDPATDIGPVIDEPARAGILAHISTARAEQRILHEGVPPEAGTIVAPEAGTIVAPEGGTFVAPTLIRVRGIEDLEREVFGPVLHLATFRAEDLSDVVAAVNASGYGLTFGIHSRIDDRVEAVTAEVAAGNVYVNRNQIGAIVGSQPFGGEGLSGTGPKAGGPHYVSAFCRSERVTSPAQTGAEADPARVAAALAALPPPSGTPRSTQSLPGPTGELNLLKTLPRGPVLCLGPSLEDARAQAALAARTGCPALTVCPGGDIDGVLPRTALSTLTPLAAVLLWAEDDDLRAARQALAARAGAILPLIAGPDPQALSLERHICVDTTAAGGNASLLAKAG